MSNSPKSLSRKAQGEETRATLVHVGARLFAQNGYHGVSMRTLAAEAGVNLATISYHFGGKAGLYEAIIQNLVDIRYELFPSDEEVAERFAEAGSDVPAKCVVVDWYITRLVHGILGHEYDHWPVFIISRELAQPSPVYPKLQSEFFQPSLDSLVTMVRNVVPEECDEEELFITAHGIIGMITKFLESYPHINARLGWDSFKGHGMNKINAVLTKRIRGFLGLPMEN